jgi:hypothetical protein
VIAQKDFSFARLDNLSLALDDRPRCSVLQIFDEDQSVKDTISAEK